MKLFEAILDANRQSAPGREAIELPAEAKAGAVPIVIFTCVDPRLNVLLPGRLGLAADEIVWLRTTGNIVGDASGEVVRSIAFAGVVKPVREIAVIGHTDCQACKTTTLRLTEAFREQGMERKNLPDDLVTFFGLFASERQNVIRGVETLRNSSLIGPDLTVHGLMLDVETGRLEKVVDGYEEFGRPARLPQTKATERDQGREAIGDSAFVDQRSSAPVETKVDTGLGEEPEVELGTAASEGELEAASESGTGLGELRLPTIKIGEASLDLNAWLKQSRGVDESSGSVTAVESSTEAARPSGPDKPSGEEELSLKDLFDQARRYKVIGSDHKVYGPIQGRKILQWITEGRIGWDTPSQMEGSQEWRPLEMWVKLAKQALKKELLRRSRGRREPDRR